MEIMSARDLSRYLKINEKKIYKLAQESMVPSMKIGGKIAFIKELIDKWMLENTEREKQIYIAGSDDFLLGSIISAYNRDHEGLVFYAPVGSINGLKILRDHGATLSCVHIIDTEKKESNLSYLNKYLANDEYVVIHLFARDQGIMVPKGNPKGIGSLEDVVVKGATFVNRSTGSGTRLLLDFLLQEKKIDPSNMKGYEVELDSHLQVGHRVLSGAADAGFGIGHVAHVLGLDFVPLYRENFEMVAPRERYYSAPVKEFLTFFQQPSLLHRVKDFTGYDTGKMGSVVFPRP
jgi:molybdate-binding protein/predicted DNA-binding transcriptional regulator AlpA